MLRSPKGLRETILEYLDIHTKVYGNHVPVNTGGLDECGDVNIRPKSNSIKSAMDFFTDLQ